MHEDYHWLDYLPGFLKARLNNRNKLQGILYNTGWLFLDKLGRIFVGLFVGVWIARYLGPTQFGLFNYSYALVTIFSVLSTLGLNGIVIRNIVNDTAAKDETIGTAFILKVIGSIVALIAVVAFSRWCTKDDSLVLYMVAVIAAGNIFQSFEVIDLWFQSQVKSKYSVYAGSSAFITCSIIKIILILAKAPLLAFAVVASVEITLGALGLIFVYHKCGYNVNEWTVKFDRAIILLKDSWPLMFSSLLGVIYLRIDQVMLGKMVSGQELGLYSAAVRVAEAFYFVPMIVVSSLFPSIVEAKSISDDVFYSRLQRLYNLMALLGYAVAIPITILSGLVVSILFGIEYAKSSGILSVLIWACIFVNIGVARTSFLTTMNWTKIHFISNLIGCVMNIYLNVLLIPYYGGMGAAIATCISYWFAAHGSCFFLRSMHKTGFMLTKAIIFPKVW